LSQFNSGFSSGKQKAASVYTSAYIIFCFCFCCVEKLAEQEKIVGQPQKSLEQKG